MYGYIKDKSQG